MADPKDGVSIATTGLNVFNTIWNWSGTSETWRVALVSVVFTCVLLFSLSVCLGSLTKLIDGLVKLVELYKTSGLPTLFNREERTAVRRRSQFCAVLEADLTNIAKAESWNDQYFTDLEAEVETEGGYYVSPLHRLLGKVSTGLRKEKSLIKAISSSSERAIQLTGEPGAGKSVAIRHLASELAIRAKRSKSKHVLIPLYVNLREIAISDGVPVTADLIRDFILDNIRRGDSDTAAYVKDNWSDYRDRGIWFFLFDSFDEIPAVLHAEKASPAIRDYAEAIRMFLEGMGECRGILASREYKGPDSLPWKKFRILRLTSSKQQELVGNAFLPPALERTVLHHLASNGSTLANTPLFLTLLCRYVKEEKVAPKNDFELLSMQIERLANRDHSYLFKTYNLTPLQLIEGAQRIARLFAEDATLGLSPTIDQVEAVLEKSEIPGGNIQRFVAAMVDSKIARADVANAAPGDRRFAFSHRRYQEALFVRHLVSQPGYLSSYDLLTDPRWREYAVTLLETQSAAALSDMFAAAHTLLRLASEQQVRRPALPPAAECCGYFQWNLEPTQVLHLLQEGLGRRISLVPKSLSLQVAAFLRPRWTEGDAFDRVNVLRVAGLLPQDVLCEYLETAFTSGSERAQNEAFNQTTSLIGSTPAPVKRAVLQRLSSGVLGARDRSALLRIEALAARLPQELGADYVLQRCQLLWRLTQTVLRVLAAIVPEQPVLALRQVLSLETRTKNSSIQRTKSALFAGALFCAYVPMILIALIREHVTVPHDAAAKVFPSLLHGELLSSIGTTNLIGHRIWLVGLALLPLMAYCIFPVLFKYRSEGERLTPKFFIRRLGDTSLPEVAKVAAFVFVFFGAVFGGIHLLGLGIVWVAKNLFNFEFSAPIFVVGIFAMMFLAISTVVSAEVISRRRAYRWKKSFLATLRAQAGDGFLTLLKAESGRQLVSWIGYWQELALAAPIADDISLQLRSTSAVLQHLLRGGVLPFDFSVSLASDTEAWAIKESVSKVEQFLLQAGAKRHADDALTKRA